MTSLKTSPLGPILVTRIVASLCIIAMALGYVSGIDLSPMRLPLGDSELSQLVVKITVVALALAVLFNVQRSAAGTLLCLILFAASYRTLLSTGDTVSFWRDLALIVAVLWTSRRSTSLDDLELTGESELTIKADPAPKPTPSGKRPRMTITRFQEDLNVAGM